MGTGMATPTGAHAHAWAAETRALRDALGAAMAAGTINRAAAPEPIHETLQAVLGEVDRLPPHAAIPALAIMSAPGFRAWVHYHRVVRAWVAGLADNGRLPHFSDEQAAVFERWLFAAAEQ